MRPGCRCFCRSSHFAPERGCVVPTSRSTPRGSQWFRVFTRHGRFFSQLPCWVPTCRENGVAKSLPDLPWLPPPHEWDFRSVTPAECRLACHWEYSRDLRLASAAALRPAPPPADSQKPVLHPIPVRPLQPGHPPEYHLPASALFPQPWLSLTRQQRACVLDSFHAPPAVQVRKLGDFLSRIQWARHAHPDALKPFLDHCFVVQPNFTRYGVETVLKQLEAWARKEARNYPPSPRARAAELPSDALKWLAVLRLDRARRPAGVTWQQARPALSPIEAERVGTARRRDGEGAVRPATGRRGAGRFLLLWRIQRRCSFSWRAGLDLV